MQRLFLLTLLLSSFSAIALAQNEIPLYPGEIPNSREVADPETIEVREVRGRAVSNTAVPTLLPSLPEHPNGKAVIICPGGGYQLTMIDLEGLVIGKALNKDSISVFVLKYRIPQDATNVDRSIAPLQDAQQAIRYVRENAKKYGVDPNQIGIMGFSAGGSLAATAATQFYRMADANETSTTSVRPDFVALIYAVISMTDELTHGGSQRNLLGTTPTDAEKLRFSGEKNVRADTPPAFLVHAADDKAVKVGNALAFYEACLAHDVPVEMHLYANGGHGFGMYNSSTEDRWTDRFVNWLRTL